MYCIKMNNDKSLSTTIKAMIYQHEKNADTLVCLMPPVYDDTKITECYVYLRYLLPDGTYKNEPLVVDPSLYKGYVRCSLSIDSTFTSLPGEVVLWLCCIDKNNTTLLKTGKTRITINKAPDRMSSADVDDVIYFNNGQTITGGTNDDVIYF